MIEFNCLKCGKTLKVKDDAAGKRGKCLKCGTLVTVPNAVAEIPFVEATAANIPQPQPNTEPLQYAASALEKTCPFCAEIIKQAAIKCKYCGANVISPSGKHLSEVPAQRNPLYDSDTREVILFEGSPSQWTNLARFIFCIILAFGGLFVLFVPDIPNVVSLASIGFAGLLALAFYIEVRFTFFKVSTERIELEKGWFSKRFDSIDLFRVKDIRLSIGIMDRIWGIGNVVVISNDTSHPVIVLREIYDSRFLYDRLKKEATRADRRRGVIHVES